MEIGCLPPRHNLASCLGLRKASGVRNVSTHSMRHTYRSWLDAVGTPVAVQQKLMRHADIRTTMDIYGDVVTDEMSVACGKVTRLALNGRGNGRERPLSL
jgi:integrase